MNYGILRMITDHDEETPLLLLEAIPDERRDAVVSAQQNQSSPHLFPKERTHRELVHFLPHHGEESCVQTEYLRLVLLTGQLMLRSLSPLGGKLSAGARKSKNLRRRAFSAGR